MAKMSDDYIINLRASNKQLKKDLAIARAKLKEHDSFSKKIGSSVATSMSQMFGVGLGISGAVQLGRSIFETTKQLDAMDKALKAISDTNEDLVTSQNYLARISETLGLEIKGLTQSYIAFTAASKGTGLEGEKSRTIFENVSKATAILGLSADDTTRALKAIAQMMSKGKVQAEELRQQLGDRVPGAFNVMAKSMGVTTAELDKMLKDGKVIADEVLPNFSRELVKTFGGDKIKRIETMVSAQNRLKNAWTSFVKSLQDGQGVVPKVFDTSIRLATDFLKLLDSNNKSLEERIELAIKSKKELKDQEEVQSLVNAALESGNKTVEYFMGLEPWRLFSNTAKATELAAQAYLLYKQRLEELDKPLEFTTHNVEKLTKAINHQAKILAQRKKIAESGVSGMQGQVFEEGQIFGAPDLTMIDTATSDLEQKIMDRTRIMKQLFLDSGESLINANLTLIARGNSGLKEIINNMDFQIEEAKLLLNDMNTIAESSLENMIAGIAHGIGSGGGIEAIFSNILAVIGNGLQGLGKALIAYGVSLDAFKKAITNPFVAIAAGAAAIAAGAAVANKATQLANLNESAIGSGGSYGGGSSAGISNYQAQAFQVESYLYIDGKQLAYELENINSRDTIRRS